ncbi:hypothetical protein, partial [Piscirickettsia salmonis]|uniref:hypothetical protein n=1 Tax=Piscirickettsia salmonis TaxID=1238 RepID=UPI003EBCA975
SKFTMKIFDLDKKVDGEFKISNNFIAPSLSIATQCFNKIQETTNKLIQELRLYAIALNE